MVTIPAIASMASSLTSVSPAGRQGTGTNQPECHPDLIDDLDTDRDPVEVIEDTAKRLDALPKIGQVLRCPRTTPIKNAGIPPGRRQ